MGIAAAAKLNHVLGRALYACNRLQNGDLGMAWGRSEEELRNNAFETMKRAKVETAKRWRDHWIRTGNIKSLRTLEEEQALNNVRRARIREIYRSHKKVG